MNGYLLGIDSGSTVTKVVIFDLQGHVVGQSEVSSHHSTPHPRWAEQDLDLLWKDCSAAIKNAIRTTGINGKEIIGIGVTAHGDGLTMIDEHGKPIRKSILSTDYRAEDLLNELLKTEAGDEITQIIGSTPFAGSVLPLLMWVKKNEPENYAHARWILFCKDWLKFKLTGEISTDITEASTGFTDVKTQEYSDRILELFDLESARNKIPPIFESATIAGYVQKEAADETGLKKGTPVIAGMHDMDACVIGTGSLYSHQVLSAVGTFSVNIAVSDQPIVRKDLLCRNFIKRGKWLIIASSAASATNLEWMIRKLMPLEVERAKRLNQSLFTFVNHEVEKVLDDDSSIIFYPYLFGSPYGGTASAGLLGLQDWHNRGHVFKAILEGVVFTHKKHIEDLSPDFEFKQVRLSGGGSKSEIWSQMFADSLDIKVEIVDVSESGALGAAICAGMGIGVYGSLEEAVEKTIRVARIYIPNLARSKRLAEQYKTYCESIERLMPIWPKIKT